MRILVIIFGGIDHQILGRLDCPHLKQVEWGPVVVDELHNKRDVATQITAQLITGKTWRDNGIPDRRKRTFEYTSSKVKFIEEKILHGVSFLRYRRRAIYEAFGCLKRKERNFLKADLKCESIFEAVPNSKAVYVPAYNPEPSWALSRNILDPREFPEFGTDGALDLREKNFHWRKQKLMESLDEDPFDLLMAQFQFIDSTQHLYLAYHDPPRMDLVESAYLRIDSLARDIIERARGKYDRILFVSDNGAARKTEWQPTHYNRPFYSTSWNANLNSPNLRDFFAMIQQWTQQSQRKNLKAVSREVCI